MEVRMGGRSVGVWWCVVVAAAARHLHALHLGTSSVDIGKSFRQGLRWASNGGSNGGADCYNRGMRLCGLRPLHNNQPPPLLSRGCAGSRQCCRANLGGIHRGQLVLEVWRKGNPCNTSKYQKAPGR